MLYSVSYKASCKQEADEIKCPSNQLGLIYGLMKEHPEKRINVFVNGENITEKDREQIQIVRKVTSENYTICTKNMAELQSLIKEGYNAYFRFPVTDWESFSALRDLGVSDIYVDGPLGFECGRLVTGVADHDIKIRVSPCISANNAMSAGNNIESFFIRPEDTKLYEPYIQIFDFETNDPDRQDALFSIYKRGLYGFDLSLLVKNLNVQVNNFRIPEDFAEHRLNCRQICKIPGKQCHLCESQLLFAQRTEEWDARDKDLD